MRLANLNGNVKSLLLACLSASFLSLPLAAQVTELHTLSEDEQKQVAIAERFVSVLERSPRRGTALDRVYGHHVEFGTLDEFLASLRARVKENPTDGVGWMLLGMFESQRGEDSDAVDAFRQAEEHRPTDALASYYQGQSLLLIGQPEAAVAAFERATERKPRRADMLEIFRQLGRVHQRAQRTDEALQVWERLEGLFPDDPRVQEQIAVTLVEEGEYKLALPRYEKLATMVKDDYRRVVFQIEAAELKIREDRRDEGLADLEGLLENLNPAGWLHRDVRRRVEEVFLRSGDQDGLVKYYEKWLAANQEDVGAMARLAKFLASSARVPEATEWMEKALKLAPSRTELRKAFIDQLVDDQRYAEASKQYEQLAKSAPGNQDFLRDWGRLVLKDKSVEEIQRKQAAGRIWEQIISIRPDDALINAQVADLYRQANIEDRALALYQKAIELAPGDPQYREYLGEYYHILKRPEEALATWQEIASGSRRTALNVGRLAEVYNSFGYLDQAVTEIAAACKLDEKDFAMQVKASEYHSRASKYEQALTFVAAAEELAANDEEVEATLKLRIEVYQSNRQLEAETDKLAQAIEDSATATVDQWHRLARYYEADRRWADATDAVEKALGINENSILALSTAARISELSGDYSRAANMNRKLAVVDRRSRSDHLMNVARLEAQLGKTEAALAAGRELIVSAPGNTDNYEFYAQLCFQLGKMEEGLDSLRKAVRINPTEPALIMSLASALSREFRTDEAIQVYWRAFDKSDEIDDKTTLTQRLTELYLQTNQFDKLLERFERDRREDSKRREMTICLAQAHHSAGDFGTARMELESLLSEDTRDTNLLQQLSKLCEGEADLDGAVEYQRQLSSIAPGHETEFRLAKLLTQRGDQDEASEIFVKLTQREENPARLLRSLDSLLRQSSFESVIAVTEPKLSEQRDDWELLYREGVAWASLEKTAEAKDRFERLLALHLPHDKLGVAAEENFKKSQQKARSNNLRGIQTRMPQRQSPLSMLNNSSQIRRTVGLDADNRYYGGGAAAPVWTPTAYGIARMAAYGWLLKFEQDAAAKGPEMSPDSNQVAADEGDQETSGTEKVAAESNATETPVESFTIALEQVVDSQDPHRDDIYNWMYVEQLRGELDSVFQIARRLAKEGGKEEQQFYLNSLRMRGVEPNQQQVRQSSDNKPKKDPLGAEDLDLILACVDTLSKDEDFDKQAAMGGQVLYSGGQTYIQVGGSWVPIQGGMSIFALGTVIEELKLGGRTEQAERLLQDRIAKAKSPNEIAGVMNILFTQKEFDELDEMHAKWVTAALDTVAKGPQAQGSANRSRSRNQQYVGPLASYTQFLSQWTGKLGEEEENAKVLAILDKALDVAVEEGKQRREQKRAKRSRRRTTPANQRAASFSLMYGKKSTYVRMDYPPANEYVDTAGLMVLRQAYEVLKRNDALTDLPDRLRQRVAEAEGNASELLYEQLMLGYVLWWMDEKDEAVEALTKAAEHVPENPAFRLEMARLHQLLGDLDSALEIVESITPRDQKLVQQRELLALQLAERLGDIDRARSAAERLFGLRLDNNTQLALVEQMRRLGLMEMAEAIVARVHRRSGSQSSSLTSLMTLYQGQGKVDLAQQIAHTVLRRTKSPMSMMASSGRNPFRNGRVTGDANRNQALRLLQQTGALKELIARMESQLERSPDSTRTYEQLIEYYQVANERDKVQQMLEQAVKNRPDAIAMRWQLAKQLEQTGKISEACDQYLEVLKKKPGWVTDDLYRVRSVFQRGKRVTDLVKAFQKINLKSVGQPHYIVDLVSQMLQGRSGQTSEESKQIALELFERVFEAFPTYRNNMISNIRDPEVWKMPRIYEIGKRAIIPSKTQANGDPWFGVNQIYSWSSGGRVNAMFEQLLNGVKGTDKMDDLRAAIEKGLKDVPDWHGGQAMLALMDLKLNKKDEAKTRLQRLVSNEDVIKTLTGDAGWIIGQELDKFDDTREVAVKLFEAAIKSSNRMNQIEYSPVVRLVKLYEDSGRKDDARDLLMKHLTSGGQNGYNADYEHYQRIQNSVWVGNRLLKMDYPVDAVKLFRELADTPADVMVAIQRYGGSTNFASQSRAGLEKSLAALNESNAGEAMSQLLAAQDDAKPGLPVLDVMLSVPTVATLKTDSMESQLARLLDSISKNDDIAQSVDARLSELRANFPADLSVSITKAMYALDREQQDVTDTLQDLASVVVDNPLDEIQEGRRPNSRQRRQALQWVPLWLVARACLESEDHREVGEKLAQQALLGARRQIKTDHAVAILYEWGNQSIEVGDKATAEAKWAELLDLVTKRPTRKKQAAQPRRGAPPSRAVPTRRTGSLPRRTRSTLHPARLFAQLNPAVSLFAAVGDTPAVGDAPAAGNPPAAKTAPEAQAAAPKKPVNRVPPLTVSQFRVTMEIAQVAASNAMPALSRRAVQKSLEGGIPVPDATALTNNNAGLVVRPSPTSTQSGSGNAIETEVASSLRKVLGQWASGDGYAPAEVYELLHPIVMPESRPAEILMYADSSKLIKDAEIQSLGVTLVDWARNGEKLDDLAARIAQRKQHDQSIVPALVLESHIALAKNDLDAAQQTLTQLANNIAERALPPMIELACHAAIPATNHTELEAPAYRILRAAIDQKNREQSQNRNQERDPEIGKLTGMVNRYLAASGNEAAVKEFFEQFLIGRQQYYSRYGGDYGQYIQWQDTAKLAEEAAKSGVTSVAMDFMGRVADYSHENYSRPSLRTSLAVTWQGLLNKTAQERYDAWYQWTMPTEGRQTIRIVADFLPPVKVPDAFLTDSSREWKRQQRDFLCNILELVQAGKAAGTLDELRKQAQQAHDEKLENAQFLLPIVLIAMDELELAQPLIEELVKTIPDRNKRESNQPRPDLSGDYIVYRTCMDHSADSAKLYGRGRQAMRKEARVLQHGRFVCNILNDYARRVATDRGLESLVGDPGLAHWVSASTRSKIEDNSEAWWVAQEDQLLHITGPTSAEFLYFAYPLTGDFEFSVDCFNGNWAESDATFGGVLVESQAYGSRINLTTVGGHESFYRKQGFKRNQEQHGRIKVQSQAGKLRYWLNNHVVYEEKLGVTSPWFGLFTQGPRLTSFKNLKLTGNPIIPREVKLIAGDSMDGWNTSFFAEQQPRRRLMAETADDPNDSLVYYQRQEPTEFDWEVKHDELQGRALPDKAVSDQSWTFYHRPLQDKETFRYEFYYVPGKTIAHPTIGRLAMLLHPDGVKSHWITQVGWDDTLAGIEIENAIEESAFQQSDSLPLKENAWNTVQLTLVDRTVQVSLNELPVFARPLGELGQRFGLFRSRQQASRVRNAVLTGEWLQEITPEIRDNLLALKQPRSNESKQLVNRLVGERLFATDLKKVVRQARAVDDEQAYQLLKDWVLPSNSHSAIRPFFELSPRQGEHATQTGDDLICPAIELVQVAKRIGKLDDLHQAVEQTKPQDDLDLRNKETLQVLVAIGNDEMDTATQVLASLFQRLQAGLPKYLNEIDRQAEFVAAWQAAQHADLQIAAQDIATSLQAKERKSKTTSAFSTLVESLVGYTQRQLAGATGELAGKTGELSGETAVRQDETGERLIQWQPVIYDKPESRAMGYRPSVWSFARGNVQHLGGETWSQLFYQSPLRGKFEIQAERTTHGWQELSIAYGMHAAEPKHDLSSVTVSKVMHTTQDKGGEVEIPRWNDKLGDFRIVVDGSEITTFVNGVQIHEEQMSSAPDPWLVLQTQNPEFFGMVNNLRITGEPEIPDEINLLEIAGLAGWRADMYGESFSHDGGDENRPWQLAGEELQGQLSKQRSAQDRESLMMYQRPMLEDGEIEFEAFFDPGDVEVHPALGRLAFVLREDGVKLHRLTDAEWDWNPTLPTNNEAVLSEKAISLKVKDWNHYRLKLVGNTLTITVNDQEVWQHELETRPQDRFFGLFRYADRNKSRVRNIVYRGDWPKQLPTLKDQQLAYPAGGPFQIAADAIANQRTIALDRAIDELKKDGIDLVGPAEQIVAKERGLSLKLRKGKAFAAWPGVRLKQPITDDFVVTVDFDGLSMQANQEGWGLVFALSAKIGDASVEIGQAMSSDGKPFVKAMRRHKLPDGSSHSEPWRLTEEITSGSLRLVRDGGNVHCLVAKKNESFRLLRTFAMGPGPAREITVQNKCSDDVGEIDVFVSNLSLITEKDTDSAQAKVSVQRKNGFATVPRSSRILDVKAVRVSALGE